MISRISSGTSKHLQAKSHQRTALKKIASLTSFSSKTLNENCRLCTIPGSETPIALLTKHNHVKSFFVHANILHRIGKRPKKESEY
jgi:hypothetical protein